MLMLSALINDYRYSYVNVLHGVPRRIYSVESFEVKKFLAISVAI